MRPDRLPAPVPSGRVGEDLVDHDRVEPELIISVLRLLNMSRPGTSQGGSCAERP